MPEAANSWKVDSEDSEQEFARTYLVGLILRKHRPNRMVRM